MRTILLLIAVFLQSFAIRQAHADGAPKFTGSTGENYFNVHNFGAAGDGTNLDSPAINQAINAAAAAGGGTVYFPAGTYLSGSIHLKSNIELLIDAGATSLGAPQSLKAYDPAEPFPGHAYQDGGHTYFHNSLIWGENLENIAIVGGGRISGKALVRERGAGGDKAIALKLCHNVTLRDFSVSNGGHFGILVTGVDNLTIDNLKIDTDRDGMDIDCCKNVRVTNCFVNAPWDDGICPKSSFALGYNRPTQNVAIANCYVSGCWQLGTLLDGTYKRQSTGGGRIKCGTESNGGFINIAISNCVFEGTQGLALETVDGALLEDITVSNITMRDITSCPIFLRLGARLRGPKGTGDQSTVVGTLRRVLISNLNCANSGARFGSILSGIPGHFIEDVKLDNIYVQSAGGGAPDLVNIHPPEDEAKYPEPGMFGATPAHGFYLRHIKNLELSHVEVRPTVPDPRPSFYLDDVHRADFIAVTAPSTPPAFSINNSTDVRILISRAAPDSITP